MYKTIIFLMILLINNFSFSQFDLTALDASDHDRKGLKMLNDARAYSIKSFELSNMKLKEVLNFKAESEKIQQKLFFEATFALSWQLFRLEKLKEQKNYLLKLIKEINNKKYIPTAKSLLSTSYINTKDFNKAKFIQNEVFKMSKNKKDKIKDHSKFGYITFFQKKYKESLSHFESANELKDDLDLYYLFIALNHYFLGDYEKASFNAGKAMGKRGFLGYSHLLAAICKYKLGEFEKSARFINRLKKYNDFEINFLIRSMEQELIESLLPDLKEVEKGLLDKGLIKQEDLFSPFIENKTWEKTPLPKNLKELQYMDSKYNRYSNNSKK